MSSSVTSSTTNPRWTKTWRCITSHWLCRPLNCTVSHPMAHSSKQQSGEMAKCQDAVTIFRLVHILQLGGPSKIVSETKYSFSQCAVQRCLHLLRHTNDEMILTKETRCTRKTRPSVIYPHQSHMKRPDIKYKAVPRRWDAGTERLNPPHGSACYWKSN